MAVVEGAEEGLERGSEEESEEEEEPLARLVMDEDDEGGEVLVADLKTKMRGGRSRMRDVAVVARPERGRCREVSLEEIVGRNTARDEAHMRGGKACRR